MSNQRPRRPKEKNPSRKVTYDTDDNPEIMYSFNEKKKIKIGIWPEANILMVNFREFYKKGQLDLPT